MDTVKRLKVVYTAEGVDIELDAKIEEALSGVGFSRYGSGYYFAKSERDLAFKREDEEAQMSKHPIDGGISES
ncbi:hypothetical protein KAR91_61960 [Candidatus Pacearchaeota archaeon]|nr:hypothetical protein [Candidatus Pacearchaeota archaeon]